MKQRLSEERMSSEEGECMPMLEIMDTVLKEKESCRKKNSARGLATKSSPAVTSSERKMCFPSRRRPLGGGEKREERRKMKELAETGYQWTVALERSMALISFVMWGGFAL